MTQCHVRVEMISEATDLHAHSGPGEKRPHFLGVSFRNFIFLVLSLWMGSSAKRKNELLYNANVS